MQFTLTKLRGMARTLKSALPRKCLNFNGSSSFVTLPVTPSTTGFTVCMWINAGGVTGNARLFDWQDGGPTNGFTVIQQSNGNINFQSNNVGSQTSNVSCGSYPVGVRVHLMVVHDGTAVTTYSNNVQVATDASAVYTAATAVLTLGKRSGGSNFFKGRVGSFMYFDDKQLDQAERDALFQFGTIPTGCTVYYDFENDVADNSGNGNDGAVTAADFELFTNPVRSLSVGSNRALDFSQATNSNVTVADNATLRYEGTQEFTVFSRLFTTKLDISVLPRMILKGAHYTSWMGDKTNGRYRNVAMELADASGAVEYWGGTQLEPRTWYDVASVGFNSGASINHYLNGVPEHMTVIAGPFDPPMDSTSGNQVHFGNSANADRPTGGYLKDIRQHNVALTESEIGQIYNGTNVTRGLVGKWDMTEGSGATIADTSGNDFHGQMANATWVTVNTRTAVASRTNAGSRTGV